MTDVSELHRIRGVHIMHSSFTYANRTPKIYFKVGVPCNSYNRRWKSSVLEPRCLFGKLSHANLRSGNIFGCFFLGETGLKTVRSENKIDLLD